MYYFAFGNLPFGAFSGTKINDLGVALVQYAGRLPPEWEPIWVGQNHDDASAQIEDVKSDLEQRFDDHVESDELKEPLFPVVRGLTELHPSKRWSTGQALLHLVRWASHAS